MLFKRSLQSKYEKKNTNIIAISVKWDDSLKKKKGAFGLLF